MGDDLSSSSSSLTSSSSSNSGLKKSKKERTSTKEKKKHKERDDHRDGKRVMGLTHERAIVFGTIAFWLGKGADEKKTHQWTAFVRGPNNEPIEFIKRVVFHLHASFERPKRVVEKPPFEITEIGWGEFEIGVRIEFADPTEKSLDLYFPLRLFPPDGIFQSTKKPVVAELYDEIVFNDPTELMIEYLQRHTPSGIIAPHPLAEQAKLPSSFNEQAELKKMIDASRRIQAEVGRLKAQFEASEREILALNEEIKVLSS